MNLPGRVREPELEVGMIDDRCHGSDEFIFLLSRELVRRPEGLQTLPELSDRPLQGFQPPLIFIRVRDDLAVIAENAIPENAEVKYVPHFSDDDLILARRRNSADVVQ